MTPLHCSAAALVFAALLATPTFAQTLPTLPAPSTYDTRAEVRAPQARTTAPGERSVLRSARNYRHETYGWRNPGGVGRSPEYYPPGDQFQNSEAGGAVPPSTFNQQTNAISRSAQLQALQVGNQRAATLQNHIDRYGRPLGFGFGYGLGGGGGLFY
ncbi:MAG: hypothetical protein ABI353_24405 [Isosphaeraceae bacterium]